MRVLLIEDDGATAHSIELMLKSESLNVYATDLGEEGVTHAIVRRSQGHAQSVVQTGDLIVNVDAKTVHIKQVRVNLTVKEYRILELLSLRRGTTITKEMILSQLYGADEPEIKIIDVFMCKIRKKLAAASNGKEYIETVWGRGYLLREPQEVKAKMSA